MMHPASPEILLACLLGLILGSFLNVVIHRLPRMMERQWLLECAHLSQQAAPAHLSQPFNLWLPRSRCPHCQHPIAWWQNIPLLSFVLLRGRCAACKQAIGWRYPLIELLTGILFAWCAWRWGWQLQTLAWCLFCALLIAMAGIDWDTTLLPDALTQPLLWAGLVAAALQWSDAHLQDAVWGAVGGYLFLWLIYWGFKLLTGKEGMGHGDFKLLAALGAWFGWQALIPIILLSSIAGALAGIGLKLKHALREGGAMPFGPFLAAAGLATMVIGPHRLLTLLGF